MRQLIHIGYPKTATTWFQNNFYPFINNANFIKREYIQENIIRPNSFDFSPDKVKKIFNFDKKAIFCEEMLIGSLYGWNNGAFAKENALRLKAIFPNANILIFIRNQFDIIASAYSQYIKIGGNYCIDKFLYHKNLFDKNNNALLFSFNYLEYDKIIEFYNELFGQSNINVFLHEDFQSDNIKFLTNFKKIFDLEVDLNKINYEKKNVSYRKYLMHIALFSNIFTIKNILYKYYLINIPYWYSISRRVFSILNKYKIFGKEMSSLEILGKKNYEYIKNYYKESNNILYDELKIKKIAEYNYPL